ASGSDCERCTGGESSFWKVGCGRLPAYMQRHQDTEELEWRAMPQEFNRVRAEQDIREAMLCPVDWAAVFRVEASALFEPLEALWHTVLTENVHGDESGYVGSDYLLADLSEESDAELRAMQCNVHLWKEAARDQFLNAVRRFTA